MAKPKTPSEAQAKKIAWLFQSGQYVTASDGYAAPTDVALIRAGWVSLDGEGTHPNGMLYKKYTLNENGLDALETYLWNRRYNRPPPSALRTTPPADGNRT